MGFSDKINNKTEDLTGKAKEAAGDVTGDDQLKNEGKGDQLSAAVKDGAEKVKDAASNIKDKLTGN
ncbi:CsbD family protein [Gordonia paraffinivorans]|uniref:CsbD-like n=1 Tax=Gordonia paraffinivorans TaxID=175628 RepID=A0ABD7V0V1_9ACTN|nr:CsbD family protein [Gordonia paraffinivorans]MCD2143988.1 CsbD family protein [Gordonia paraffinivorans]VFA83025.1 CsbD-like [Gordonia paraffinivorans]